jgi:hypothetical protein
MNNFLIISPFILLFNKQVFTIFKNLLFITINFGIFLLILELFDFYLLFILFSLSLLKKNAVLI